MTNTDATYISAIYSVALNYLFGVKNGKIYMDCIEVMKLINREVKIKSEKEKNYYNTVYCDFI